MKLEVTFFHRSVSIGCSGKGSMHGSNLKPSVATPHANFDPHRETLNPGSSSITIHQADRRLKEIEDAIKKGNEGRERHQQQLQFEREQRQQQLQLERCFRGIYG